MLMKLSPIAVQRLVSMGLEEDAPTGDLTSQALIPESAVLRAQLTAREAGVLSGEDFFTAAMSLTDVAIKTQFLLHDADRFPSGAILATVQGPARGVLQAERVALNFIQRMSGIATVTAQYVAAASETKARIVDTRKTTPGLRLMERYAVRCGGGHNHRFSLSEAVMAKDNHLAVLASTDKKDLAAALKAMRDALPHTVHVEVEVDKAEQIETVLAGGADSVLLDNFTVDQLRSAVRQIGGRALVEASGGITLERIPQIAATGVDIISVGALTHSARSLDLGLDVFVET